MVWIIIVISFISLILLYEFAEFLYKKTEHYKNSLGGCQFFKNVPNDLEIVNIGSGPGRYAITYDIVNKNGFNFSTIPQSFKYGFRLLNRYKSKIKEGAYVIIVIMSPLSFGKNSEYNKPDYSDKFYGVLPKSEIDNYSLKRLWLVNHPLLKDTLYFIKRLFSKNKKKKSIQADSDVPGIIQLWKEEFLLDNLIDPEQSFEHQKMFEEKINILEKGISFCKGNGWKPLLVIPPVPKKTRNHISDAFLKRFVYDNLETLKSRFSNLILLDYYKDSRFQDSLFKNDIFVNEEGRFLFSEILFNDIENISVKQK